MSHARHARVSGRTHRMVDPLGLGVVWGSFMLCFGCSISYSVLRAA